MPETESGSGPAAALRVRGLSPRKRLGQNFLRDRSFLARILEAAGIEPGDEVLELGAGTGVLTGALADGAGRVMAVELDDNLAGMLEGAFGTDSNVEIWHGNALDFDPCSHFTRSYKLVGNIPYYITGPILRHYLESACPPQVMVLMVQREVAQRMTAKPGDLSLLGVSVQYYAHPRLVARVPAGAFYPRPKVDSAIVQLVPYRSNTDPKSAAVFFDVARAGFGMRRKQLVNSLKSGLGLSRAEISDMLGRAGIDGSRRAESLSIPEWETLARAWSERLPVETA